MRLAYTNDTGQKVFVDMTDRPLVIGCSPEADIILDDSEVSRLLCGIRMNNGTHYIKDLGSANGTCVNSNSINSPTPLQPGDCMRIGDTLFSVEEKLSRENAAILHEIEEEMGHGKGYSTLSTRNYRYTK